MRRMVRTAAWMVLIILIALGPVWLAKVPDARKRKVEEKYASWTGVLRLWKCEGFGYGNGSLTAWLNGCISAFEKAHPGVYVQLTDVSAEAMKKFETSSVCPPDMILFSPGMLDAPYSLMELERGLPVRPTAEAAGEWHGALYAVPVAMGGYAMAVNAKYLPEVPADWSGLAEAISSENVQGLNAPADSAYKSWSAALIHLFSGTVQAGEKNDRPPVGEGIDLGLVEEQVQETRLPVREVDARNNRLPGILPDDFRQGESVVQQFTAGEIAAMPVTLEEVGRLRALSESGKMTDWRAERMGLSFTDQITFFAVTACPKDDLPARQKLCTELLRLMLSEELQKKLTSAGALPARDMTGLYQGIQGMNVLEEALASEELVCAPAFGNDWRAYADDLMDGMHEGEETAGACELLREMLMRRG